MLHGIDIKLFYLINKALASKPLDVVMLMASNFTVNGLLPLAAIVFLFLKGRENRITGLSLLAGLTIEYHTVHVLKEWIGRPRPFIALPDARVLQGVTDYAFPSGHATIAFMAAVVLSNRFRAPRGLFFSLAALVGISRIYVGAHFPSDVVAGALFGSAIGYILVRATDKK